MFHLKRPYLGGGGLPQPHTFTIGAGEVIEGLEIGTLGMQEGGVRRVVIPPPLSYQDKSQEPVPRDFSNRQRLYTTIFNPTRLANGEGDTLSTVIFDVELVRVTGAISDGGSDDGGGGGNSNAENDGSPMDTRSGTS